MNGKGESRSYEFGGFRLDAAQRRLVGRDGAQIPLPSRAFDVLLFLVEHPGEPVGKSALIKAVWPNTIVEEGNLTQSIFALRRALGDGTGEPRFIVTIPGRGYQFVAAVTVSAGEPGPDSGQTEVAAIPSAALAPTITNSTDPALAGPPAEVRTPPARYWIAAAAVVALVILAGYLLWTRQTDGETELVNGERRSEILRSIVVLPFDDLSPRKDMEYFGDGLAEELMSTLGKVRGLQVVSRRSAFTFKNRNEDVRQIGAALNVESVLEGSVRREGDRLRISAQLSRASDGYSLWTEAFDRKMDEVLDVQGAIARDVARALNPLFTADETIASRVRTGNSEAYASYLRGVFFFGKADPVRAQSEFLRATQLDPQFAMAFAQLARCHEIFSSGGAQPVENRKHANTNLARALKLDPTLEDVWWVYSLHKREDAEQEEITALLERAVAEDSSDADAMLELGRRYAQFGRRDESLAMLERAYRSDPMWVPAIASLAQFTYSFKGDRKRFLELVDSIERVDPGGYVPLYLHADLAFDEGRALDWDDYQARLLAHFPNIPFMHSALAQKYADLGLVGAAAHHASAAMKLPGMHGLEARNLAHIHLYSEGDIPAARRIIDEGLKQQPDNMDALRAQAQLKYFEGDCAGARESLLRSDPSLGAANAAAAISVTAEDWEVIPLLIWCLRQQGDVDRQSEIFQAWSVAARPPTNADVDAIRARASAARGDRNGLIENLKLCVDGKAPVLPFSRFEPMIKPWLKDPEVAALLATLDARRAEWRKILQKSSLKLPNPGAPKSGEK